ncbi:MAG: O-antigen ligase family protein, partial [Myxococcales bacterium]
RADAPLSLDPGATLIEALKLWTYACVLTAGASLASRRRASLGALVLCGSALLLALVTLAHGIADATQVFGIYTPRLGGKGFRVAPLINPNNLAGYLNLGFAAGLGLLATDEPPLPRWLIALSLTPIVGMCVLTGSRAGIGGLALSLLLAYWLLKPKADETRDKRRLFRQSVGAAALVLAVAVALAGAASGTRLWHLLFEDNLSKLRLASAAIPLVRQYFWLGIGRGAFESVFPGTHTAPDNSIFSHPENFLLQWASEWGVPITLLALGGILLVLRRGRLGPGESRVRRALLAGILALAAQNLFDLAFEIPGVVIALMVAVAFALRPGEAGGAAERRPSRVPRAAQAGAVLLVGLAVIGVAWRGGNTSLTMDRDLVRSALPTKSGDTAQYTEFATAVRAAMDRHPAEPYFPRLAALVEWRFRQNPLRFVNRALERGPSEGRTHYLLGQILAARGLKAQALLELRSAAEFEPSLVSRIAAVVLKLTLDGAELSRAAPEGANGAPMLLALAGRLPRSSEPTALALIEEALQRDPANSKARIRLVKRLVASLADQGPTCSDAARERCIQSAKAQLAALEHLRPPLNDLATLRASFLLAIGQIDEALRSIDGACAQMDDRSACLSVWLQAVAKSRDGAALTRVARAVQTQICPNEKGCPNLLWATGEVALSLGNVELALGQFEKAAAEDSTSARWRGVSHQATKAGYPGRALRAMERAVALAPRDMALANERNALRQSALRAIH